MIQADSEVAAVVHPANSFVETLATAGQSVELHLTLRSGQPARATSDHTLYRLARLNEEVPPPGEGDGA